MTGGTGFIGRFIVRSLLSARWRVRILARRPTLPAELAGSDVEVVLGDVLDGSTLERALEGVAAVCHCAAEKRDLDRLFDVNVGGTECLLTRATSAGVRRFVYVSSVAAMGASGESVIDENYLGEHLDSYGKSKRMAEELVINLCGASKIDYIVVRPTNVFGEADPEMHLLTLSRLIKRRAFWFIGDGGGMANYVYVRDVGSACATLIADPVAANQAYIISDPCTLEELVSCIGSELAISCSRKRMPVWAAYGVSIALTGMTRCIGVRSPLPMQKVRRATSRLVYSPSKLRELAPKWPPHGWREGIRRTLSAYRAVGAL